jgi:hypothetical protein
MIMFELSAFAFILEIFAAKLRQKSPFAQIYSANGPISSAKTKILHSSFFILHLK